MFYWHCNYDVIKGQKWAWHPKFSLLSPPLQKVIYTPDIPTTGITELVVCLECL